MTSKTASPGTQPLTVALIGNPNTGKSTLFSALSGFQTLIGNYPGVTVEKKLGKMRCGDRTVQLVDLPGTYSLSPRSLDEMVAVNVLLGRQAEVGTPHVVICIVDASNIERNLYLVSQVLDVGLPAVLVLNMTDVAETRGVKIDAAALSQRLGLPVIETQAHRKQGMDELRSAILRAAEEGVVTRPRIFPAAFVAECERLDALLANWGKRETPHYLLERLLLDVGGWLESHLVPERKDALLEALAEARGRLATMGCKVPAVEARVRFQWAREVLNGVMTRPAARPVTTSDRLDRFLTHRVTGLVTFAVLMFVIFQALYTWAAPLMDLCEQAQGWLGGQVSAVLAPGPLQSLLVDGVIAGVGGVLIFLPQIVILFLFIALLEDCGYMARAAFLMDKLMTKVGLSGKSFVPLMSSFACAIPGVMATRVIENPRDRMTTILVAPLMSCSARQPVYLLLIFAFIPPTMYLGGWVGLQGIMLFAMTSLGALVAIPVAWILKKTVFKGETPPFVMELPSYKWPSLRIVLHRVYSQGKAFVVRAGTLIFATTVVVWAAGYFPGDRTAANALQLQVDAAQEAQAEELEQREELRTRLDELDNPPAPSMVEWIMDGFAPPAPPSEADVLALQTEREQVAAELAELETKLQPHDALIEELNTINGTLQEQSYLGQLGHVIEPVVRPLGWDWRIGVGVIASFPAREVIIGTLGTIYSLGNEVGEADQGLQNAIQSATWPDGRKVYNIPVALSIMVFFALCAQCASTLMVIRRETNSWFWPLFTFSYMTGLAYVGALLTYNLGMLFLA